MKTLVINNNEETNHIISKFFKESGFSVSISTHPFEGLNLIRQEKFDVILLDVNMDVVNGIGVIELLASEDILKDQNIFIFSQEDVSELQVKNFLRKDGVNGFLKKPIQNQELQMIIGK